MADVGACFEALLAQPTIRQRLARSGGLTCLDDATVARLAVLAALHDIGKANVGFQAQIWRPEDVPRGRKIRHNGHIADLAPVLNWKDGQTAAWFFEGLQWSELEQWDDAQGNTVCGLFLASLSHHGRPFQFDDPKKDENPRAWEHLGQLEPRQFVERVGQLIRHWFPQAFSHDAPLLPPAPSFQHHFLGLCNLADWVGSNETWFKYIDTPDDDYIDRARERAEGAIKAIGLHLSNHVVNATCCSSHSQRKLSLPHLPRYWLSSQYQALRNGRQRLSPAPSCGGLSNPVVNATCCSSGEPVSKWGERRSAPWPGLRTRWRSGCPGPILGNQRIRHHRKVCIQNCSKAT